MSELRQMHDRLLIIATLNRYARGDDGRDDEKIKTDGQWVIERRILRLDNPF